MNFFNRHIIILLLILCSAKPAVAEQLQRTTMKVSNFYCMSCLNIIEEELKKIPGMTGVTADLQNSTVSADHGARLKSSYIARLISDLGYEAKIITEENISYDEAVFFSKQAFARCGTGGCNIRNTGKGCNATASAWKKLYQRYFANR